MTMACRRHDADGTQSLCNPYAPSDNLYLRLGAFQILRKDRYLCQSPKENVANIRMILKAMTCIGRLRPRAMSCMSDKCFVASVEYIPSQTSVRMADDQSFPFTPTHSNPVNEWGHPALFALG
jgi:hypothetical protein